MPLTSADGDDEDDPARTGGPISKLKTGFKTLRGDKKTAQGTVKMLRMSKEDYAKYWAKDDDGNYIGTEPEGEGRKIWAEELKE